MKGGGIAVTERVGVGGGVPPPKKLRLDLLKHVDNR